MAGQRLRHAGRRLIVDTLQTATADLGHYVIRSESPTFYLVHLGMSFGERVVRVYRHRTPGAESASWHLDHSWIVVTLLRSYRLTASNTVETLQWEIRPGYRPRWWAYHGNWMLARETVSIERIDKAGLLELGVTPLPAEAALPRWKG